MTLWSSIFFQVTGDTIYNMVKLSETETDAQERPINPHYIKTTTVLNNPFDDIKPRNAEAQPKKDKVKDPNKKKKSKGMLLTRKSNLLKIFKKKTFEKTESVPGILIFE